MLNYSSLNPLISTSLDCGNFLRLYYKNGRLSYIPWKLHGWVFESRDWTGKTDLYTNLRKASENIMKSSGSIFKKSMPSEISKVIVKVSRQSQPFFQSSDIGFCQSKGEVAGGRSFLVLFWSPSPCLSPGVSNVLPVPYRAPIPPIRNWPTPASFSWAAPFSGWHQLQGRNTNQAWRGRLRSH